MGKGACWALVKKMIRLANLEIRVSFAEEHKYVDDVVIG
jgi:hypothetical protein